MDVESSATEVWAKTRDAVAQFRKLLLCSKCSNILSEPVCLGVCEHLLCRSCAGPRAGDGCSVCHSPAWVKDVHRNRQLSNIAQLFLDLEALLQPPESTVLPAQPATPSAEPSLPSKKNFKIWFSPESRRLRCRVETPAVPLSSPHPGPSRLTCSDPLSVFNFSSSQDSGSSTPPGPRPGPERRRRRRRRRGGVVSKIMPTTRNQSRCVLKRTRLEAANRQWGIGQESVASRVREDPGEERGTKKVSFQCPGDPILKDGPMVLPEAPSPNNPPVYESPSPNLPPNQPRPPDVDPQITPKRPRLSPTRKRRSGPHSQSSPAMKTPETPKEGHKGTRSVSPASTRSQSSPAYSKRNHRGETPLHLAAIKGDVEAVRELLALGADPNLKDHAGWTPLHEACNLGHVGVVEVLLQQGALLNTPGYENDTPLHDAARNGHLAVARVLVQHGALTGVRNIFGLRPVDCTASSDMRVVLDSAPEVSPVSSPANQTKIGMRRDVQVTLISSSLSPEQQQQITRCVQVLGARHLQVFSNAVTHVIVPDGPARSTRNVLRGVLQGCWVVTFKWLSESLLQGRWVEEEDFEVGEGPRRARLNRTSLLPPLFDGCFFFLPGCPGSPPRAELVELVRAGGGQLLRRRPKADSDVTQAVNTAAYHAPPGTDRAFCTHYVLHRPGATPTPGPVRRGKVWAAPTAWLLDCIMAFTLLPVPERGQGANDASGGAV